MSDVGTPNKPRNICKWQQESSLEDAVFKWHVQQCSCGVNVLGVKMKSAANTLANHINISFKVSDGWL
jgi:hypothetical protein